MSHPFTAARAVLAAAVGALALASPAAAEPVKAGPPTPDELAVLAVGGAVATPATNRTDQVAVHRLSTADGAYRGRIAFPTTNPDALTIANESPTVSVARASIKRSVDGRYLTFAGVKAPANQTNQDSQRSTAVRIAADGTYTDTLLGTGFMTSLGQRAVGAVTVDGSRYWIANTSQRQLATIAPGATEMTQVAAPIPGTSQANVAIVDGALYTTNGLGVYRVPGPLPTAADAITVPQQVIASTGAFDSAFVDTDGAGGVDTAYVSRAARGLAKYVLAGGQWTPAGNAGGDFRYLAARAVAGGVEIYASTSNNSRVQKLVDSAEVGGELTTTGATTLAIAPARARYAGLTFAPGDGFPADPTPYPATPPVAYASATAIDTHLQANPRPTITLDVYDPNVPASEITLTATSSSQTVLPNARITIAGDGVRRTVTLDPAATGSANVTLTVRSGDDQVTLPVAVAVTGLAPDPTSHYYSGAVDLSAALDVGGDYFLGISDEINTPHLYRKGVSGAPLASFGDGFPGGESDFEGVTRFGDTILWTASHGNNRSGSSRPERRFLAFTKVTGSGANASVSYSHEYTRLWQQWKDWDAANGHGLGANYLKFASATVPNLLPNAPFGFNVEGLTMAPGSSSEAWFGMRAPTISGSDGIERALILPVTNIDKLTSNAVDAQFGQPIFLDLGGRSIRDISKNAADQYLITAGTGDTQDSLKNWALYTWDGNRAHDPVFVNLLPTDEARIGAWEGIAEVPNPLVPGSRALLTADSGDTGLGKSYGQYVTIGEPAALPAVPTGVTATAKPGQIDIAWDAAARADRYYVSVKNPAGQHAPGSPIFVTGTSTTIEGLTAGTEYTVTVRAQNVATRTAHGTPATATPTTGARASTTTGLELVGTPLYDEPLKLVATVSDPGVRGTVQFFNGNSVLSDAVLRETLENGTSIFRTSFPVVDGKAEINVKGNIGPALVNLRAVFTTANPENFTSSESPVTTKLIDYRPRIPGAELLSITGDRVVGGRIAIKVKLRGFTPGELYPTRALAAEFSTRRVSTNSKQRLVGDTPGTADGTLEFDSGGEATFTTTALAAGEHRISAYVPSLETGVAAAYTAEVPLTIAAAAPAPEAPAYITPKVVVTVSGSRVSNQPITLTARVSDPSLTGTVQFFRGSEASGSETHGRAQVVNGVASITGSLSGSLNTVFARFEPSADRERVATATSMVVPVFRAPTTAPPIGPPTATATALDVSGSTALVTVSAVSEDPLAARDLNGYVELVADGAVVDIASVLRGQASFELATAGKVLQARFVPADLLRALPSASATRRDVEAGAGGDVPATLALTLGAQASFGSFTPGVARDYTASTTATVVSTAGDAALSVVDPSTTVPGRLVNGAFSLPQTLQVRDGSGAFAPVGAAPVTVKSWAAPASNDVASVDFKQSIAAADALRTGRYGKTLTLTLSTTAP